jgi:competence protein ComEC
VTARDTPPDCAAMVVGRALWREQGALAFRRYGSGFVMESSRPANYDRPWAPAPLPRHAPPESHASGGVTVPEASKPAPRDATPRSEDLDPNE